MIFGAEYEICWSPHGINHIRGITWGVCNLYRKPWVTPDPLLSQNKQLCLCDTPPGSAELQLLLPGSDGPRAAARTPRLVRHRKARGNPAPFLSCQGFSESPSARACTWVCGWERRAGTVPGHPSCWLGCSFPSGQPEPPQAPRWVCWGISNMSLTQGRLSMLLTWGPGLVSSSRN